MAMARPWPRITPDDIQQGHIIDWRMWVNAKERPQFDVVIPSHARPHDLCETTLALLHKHEVDLSRVHVFVDFNCKNQCGVPAYETYVLTLRQYGFHAVHVRPGGPGLEGNMKAIRQLFDIGTYLITMSDKVCDVLEIAPGIRGEQMKISVPNGSLLTLWHHGYDLLKAGGFAAWSTNATHSVRTMRADALSRKAGLLDGNMTGQLVTHALKEMQLDHGLIYDVEYAAALWDSGQRYVRYRGICCKHPYRSAGGQANIYPDPTARRHAEDSAIRALAQKYPKVVRFTRKPSASLKVMQYSFRPSGPAPLIFNARHGLRKGRRRRYDLKRAATGQERMVLYRKRLKKATARKWG